MRVSRIITLVCAIWAPLVFGAPYESGDVVVIVFERGEPAPGVRVTVDGSERGTTNEAGVAEVVAEPGRHELGVLRDGVALANVVFTLDEQEGAEVSVNLAGLGRPAATRVRNFAADATADIEGVVRDSTGTPLAGAQVVVEGRDESVTTGADGAFLIEVPRGVYTLRATRDEYRGRRFAQVRALAVGSADLELTLDKAAVAEAGGPIEEVYVLGRYQADTAILLKRDSESVLDLITEEDISLAGDSTAIDALQRVTGVTVQGDIAIVRGLGERYSTTFFNGAELPSPDPTRRAVGLNIFPSELTSGIEVQKTYSADLPGDFSGGAVKLQTRSIPDELTGRVSVSSGGNSRSTFQDGFTHNGGDRDFTGFDDGDRDIPGFADAVTNGGQIPLSSLSDEDRQQVALEVVEDFRWNLRGFELPADFDADFALGNRFQIGDTSAIGASLSGLYDSEWRYVNEDRAEIIADAQGDTFEGEGSSLERSENEIRLGGVVNLVADLGLDHTLNYISFLSRESLKGTFFEEGFNRSDDRDFRRVVLEFTESQLFTNQLSGEHNFPALGDLSASWQAAYSNAERDEPGTREYTYSVAATATDQPLRLATGPGEAGLPPLLSWEYLDEDSIDLSVDLSVPLEFRGGRIAGDFRVGGRYTDRDREFDSVRWRYSLAPGAGQGDPLFFPSLSFPSVEMILTPRRVGPNGFQLNNASSALAGGANADNYTGVHEINAGYILGDFDFGAAFRVQAGVRVESSELFVETDAIAGGTSQTGGVDETDVLPSLNVTWFVNDDSQVRFGASRTINRPQFRELSPSPFRDPETRFESVGNPNLEQAEVDSFDLRYEYYFSGEEGVTIGAFYKELTNPIEVVTIGGGSDDRGVRSFANADSAELYGVELDGRVSMASFIDSASPWANFYLTGNVALIDSEVTVGESNLGIGTNNERELQGQSPWVANVGLGYSSISGGTDALLLFNMFGERITEAGVNGAPDAKEQPVALLDFNFKQLLFDNWAVGIKLRNILDSEFEVEQGGGLQRAFEKGRELTVSLTYDF
ncbi:MAG: TonB-dependent receptor [Halioglobus sp.]|nr:TonB-dependent receptor [Halioglobus sp.]